MRFDTKIAVVVRADLPTWQKLNMTAFLVSGIAATEAEIVGEPYEDASGTRYLPMFRQPVLVFGATAEQLREVYRRSSPTSCSAPATTPTTARRCAPWPPRILRSLGWRCTRRATPLTRS